MGHVVNPEGVFQVLREQNGMSTPIRATQASLPSAAAVGGWYGGTILVVEGRHDGDRESDGLLHEVQDSTRNQESQVDHDEKWSTCDRGYLFGLQHKDVQNRRGQVTRRQLMGRVVTSTVSRTTVVVPWESRCVEDQAGGAGRRVLACPLRNPTANGPSMPHACSQ